MSRARRRPWLTVLVGAALALAVVTRTLVPAISIHAVGDPVIVAAGDIACGVASQGSCFQNSTESAIATVNPDAVLPLGDEQYECGDLSDWSFSKGYGPSWGNQKAVTRPATGNHEYKTSTDSSSPCYNRPAGAPGYYSYFGSAASPLDGDCSSNCKGYYSFDLGAWHLIALNAQCAYVSCAAGSPQEQWLKADLAAHPNTCVLAFWHQMRWSSGGSGNLAAYDAFWQDLYAAGADVVLSAHDHDYERFAPQDPSQNLDLAHGIREFVVGTGGRNLSSFPFVQPNSELRQRGTFGVLKLTLHPTSYDWQFIRTAGQPMPNGDSGTTTCSPSSAAVTATPTPTATAAPATATSTPTATAAPATATGTPVSATATPTPTPAPGGTLFSDGFESGNFSAWSTVQTGGDGTATVQSSVVKGGSDAAKLAATANSGSKADVRKTLSPTQTDLTASGDFQVSQEGASGGNVPLLRLFDSAGNRLISLFRQNQATNKLYVGYSGTNHLLSGTLPLSTWAHFDVHMIMGGTGASTVEVTLNGTVVYQTSTASLGTAGVATVQIGNDTAGQAGTVYADNITVTS